MVRRRKISRFGAGDTVLNNEARYFIKKSVIFLESFEELKKNIKVLQVWSKNWLLNILSPVKRAHLYICVKASVFLQLCLYTNAALRS